MKQTVIIYNHYVELSRKAERLFIKTAHTESSIPLSNIDGILIFGKVKLTSDAISLCMKKQIPILLLTIYGQIKAQILPPIGSETTKRRLKQVGLYFLKRLDIAKYLIKRKCLEIEYTFDINLEHFKVKVEKVSDYAVLLGLEGQVSKLMFQKFEEMIRPTSFTFRERNYHPPKDEVNALLSFIYTLGYNLSTALILLKGFDPYISFLHSKRGSHAAFSSDLMEIIRPKLTHFCGEILLNKLITSDDFMKKDDCIMLKKSSIAKVLTEFSNIKENLLELLKEFLIEFEGVEF
ncbi:CRISPR-associated endonuclease Cas1 [Thermodesulfobacterium sp. TA1]|uniref:CRISPR-associated endonuclease Cas1 n=1 Tax=Thermodesulfobacterium sp. TA1 TaxID=2234087 RepID=UPI00123299C3|nr:CRISPR-associated endonuclease Cas1 [Thermodesulfobacterium sp. TA1]QER42729.1 CRISPR-associated endonuclease Cas1 [Thermodesulfobacterium sp. TA1]